MNLNRETFKDCNNSYTIGLPLLWGMKEIRIEVAERLHLDSNPLKWSVADVVRFIRSTDCAPLARIFLDQVTAGTFRF